MSPLQRVGDTSADDRDVIAMATDLGNECVISIFFIRSGKMIGREHYHMSGVNAEAYSTIMESFSQAILRFHSISAKGDHYRAKRSRTTRSSRNI